MEAARNEARFNNAKYDAAWAIRFRPEPEAARTRPGAHHVRYAARHLVIDEGDAARAVYEVLDGGVILFKLLPDGRRQIIELLGVVLDESAGRSMVKRPEWSSSPARSSRRRT